MQVPWAAHSGQRGAGMPKSVPGVQRGHQAGAASQLAGLLLLTLAIPQIQFFPLLRFWRQTSTVRDS
jgi:hypothetical protein